MVDLLDRIPKHARQRADAFLRNLYPLWWDLRRSEWLRRLSTLLRTSGRVFLPIGVALQFALVLTYNAFPRFIPWLNVLAVGFYGIGELLLLLGKGEARPRVRDMHELRLLIRKLDDHTDALAEAKALQRVEDLSREYFFFAYRVACTALSLGQRVRITLMLKDEHDCLRVHAVYPETADVDRGFTIRLVSDPEGNLLPENGLGAAGWAYATLTTVYVPSIQLGVGLTLDAYGDGTVERTNIGQVWLPGTTRRYNSVICTPAFCVDGDERIPVAVLNLESRHRDPFQEADFHLACAIASLLAQGMLASERRREQINGASQVRPKRRRTRQ